MIGGKCNYCNSEYKSLGHHWSANPNHRPPLTEHQLDITTGLLMGDGSIVQRHNTPKLTTGMVAKEYLEYLDSIFGKLSLGVSLMDTAAESAARARKSGANTNADGNNYNNVYRWRTTSHQHFEQFSNWYSSGEKIWPDDITLTPTVLKHWYCGDGYYANTNGQNYIGIGMSNEMNNTDKINKYFNDAGLPTPTYNKKRRNPDDEEVNDCLATFTVEQSRELWEYMGDPLPYFEYKWPDDLC